MNARQAVELVVERKKPSPDWTSTNGIYADLSKWPHEVEYYVECPKCHQVHGNYKTMREAHTQRLCAGCNLTAIGKIKDQVRQVVAEPWRKVRTLASIVRETEGDVPVPLPPEDDDDDTFLGRDPMAEIERMLFSRWTQVAVRDLVKHLNAEMDDAEIKTDGGDYGGDYDEEDPNNTTYFGVEVNGESWMIFADDDRAEQKAIEIVKQDVEQEPGLFSQELLSQFIDEERLANAIGDPYDDHGQEERELDYEDRLQKMVDEDKIEDDDPVFFKKNGQPRIANKAREKQLDDMLEQWIEDTKPTLDPWEWLRDCFGKEKASEEAIKLAGVDEQKLAEYVVHSDGWQNTIARYDHNSVDLENGAVACRTN